MEFNMKRNGRSFTVDWKLSSVGLCSWNQEFTIGDCCFLLEFSPPADVEASGITMLKLSKKDVVVKSNIQPSTLMNRQLREVSISKDADAFEVMPKASVNHWIPFSWDLFSITSETTLSYLTTSASGDEDPSNSSVEQQELLHLSKIFLKV